MLARTRGNRKPCFLRESALPLFLTVVTNLTIKNITNKGTHRKRKEKSPIFPLPRLLTFWVWVFVYTCTSTRLSFNKNVDILPFRVSLCCHHHHLSCSTKILESWFVDHSCPGPWGCVSALDTLLPRAPALSPPAISPSDPAFQQGAPAVPFAHKVCDWCAPEGGWPDGPPPVQHWPVDRQEERGLF